MINYENEYTTFKHQFAVFYTDTPILVIDNMNKDSRFVENNNITTMIKA